LSAAIYANTATAFISMILLNDSHLPALLEQIIKAFLAASLIS
jgi:hypothetical protein